jgi:hypothetical protein
MAHLTNFAENALIDFVFRGQAWSLGASLHIGLLTTAPTDSTAGTEASYAGATPYARQAVTRNLASWAGTQGATTTVASSGTGGTTSNNGQITFPQKQDAGSITVVAIGIYDAATGGNLIAWAPLDTNKTVNQNDPAPYIAISALTFQIDN